jgi:hypothetical protein
MFRTSSLGMTQDATSKTIWCIIMNQQIDTSSNIFCVCQKPYALNMFVHASRMPPALVGTLSTVYMAVDSAVLVRMN